MERNFSVDDIVGTLWHSSGDLSIGVQSGAAGNGGEDEYNHKGMNRSASEFAFQEFIRHGCPKPPHNGTLTHVSSDDEAEDDEDFSLAPQRDEAENGEEPSQENGSKPEQPKHGDVARKENTSGSEVDNQPDWSLSKPQEMARSPLEEPEIKAALNPLFSGLHSEMTPISAECDPQELNTFYQQKLVEACLRVRMAREGGLGLPEAGGDHSGLRQANGATSGQFGAEVGNIRTGSGGLMPESQGIPSKPVTSGSSQEQTDDEDCENEQNLEPGDKKRVKRMLSNRESARRSRRRKQAHLNELEAQVAQLRVQNSTLSESLQTTNQKLKDASKDNLQLKTFVEMLKAKLLAATTLHRQLSMAGSNVQSHARLPLGTQELPVVSSSFGWESGVHHMQLPRSSPFLMHPPLTVSTHSQMSSQHPDMDANIQQSISQTVQQGMKMTRTPSMQRVASADHLKKKIRNAGASFSPASWNPTSFADVDSPSMVPQFSLSSDY